MSPAWPIRVALSSVGSLLVSGTLAASVWAQAPVPGPSVTPPAPIPGESAGGGGPWLIALVLAAALVAILVVTVKMLDHKRKRETETVSLQAQIADALLRDPAVFRLSIIPTARIPLWRGTPATIEVRGEVPTPELRQAILRLVEQEASRVRSDFRIEDRIMVLPTVAVRAA